MLKTLLFRPAVWFANSSASVGIAAFAIYLAPLIILFLLDTFFVTASLQGKSAILPGHVLILQGAWWYYFYKALPVEKFSQFWIAALRPAMIGMTWAKTKKNPIFPILLIGFAPTFFVFLPLLVFFLIVMEPPLPRSLEAILLLGFFYMFWGGAVGISAQQKEQSEAK